MACYTQEEIAEREGIHKDTISEICREMADLPKSAKTAAEHATDVTHGADLQYLEAARKDGWSEASWKQRSCVRWLADLLYWQMPYDTINRWTGGYRVSTRTPRKKERQCAVQNLYL